MKTEIVNLYKCAAELDVPVKWLKKAAIEGKVPCLWVSKRQPLFNVKAVKKAITELAESKHTERKLADRRKTVLQGLLR